MTIAWLSGSSDPRRSALSVGERRLLQALAGPLNVIDGNFPWPAAPGSFRRVPLVIAAIRNATQFWRARLSRRYRRFIAHRLTILLERRPGRLLIVAGSQGLELLRLAWPLLDPQESARVRVIALGPVAGPLPPGLRPMVVRSAHDRVSRLGWRGPVDLVCGGGHLDYLDDPLLIGRLLPLVPVR